MKPLDPSWWRPTPEGDYTQQNGHGVLRRMTDSGGRTAGWVLYVDGELQADEWKTLREAKLRAAHAGDVTSANITDEQILALAADPRSSLRTKAWCIAAMRLVYGGSRKQATQRAGARARCAAIINARNGAKP